MEKRITYVEYQYALGQKFIKSTGETRFIKLHGTPGAGFSMEVNDSNDYCILEDPIKNVEIPSGGVYTLKQKFPSVTNGLKEEHYTIKIIAHADVDNQAGDIRLYQYPDPTITIATSHTGAVTTAYTGNSDITISKPVYFSGEVEQTQTLTITEGGDGGDIAGYHYVKGNVHDNISKNTTYTKVVTTSEEPKMSDRVFLKPLSVKTTGSTTASGVTRGGSNYLISGKIEEGTRIYSKLTKEKIVYKSLDVPTCQRATNKFELSDTIGLFKGMRVKVNGVGTYFIESVDCKKNITIDKKAVIKEGKTIYFDYEIINQVGRVETQINENGNACVVLSNKMMIVNDMVLTLDVDHSKVSVSPTFTGSGTNTVTMSNVITINKFGKQDVTHTIDLTDIVTRTPNAYDIKVNVPRNSERFLISTLTNDFDASTKTVVINQNGKNGTALVSSRNILYTPNPNYTGFDKILYTLSDGTNASLEKEIEITVTGAAATQSTLILSGEV